MAHSWHWPGSPPRSSAPDLARDVLELHRLRSQLDLPESALDEAGERFRQYLVGDAGPSFLARYPVLARALAELSVQHRRNAAELARRVRDDATLLAERFGGGRPLGIWWR